MKTSRRHRARTMMPIREIELRIAYGARSEHRTAPIDRYRYEDNGRHGLILTMTLNLEIEDYHSSVTTNKLRPKDRLG